jgi:hypothetical protein
MALTAVFIPELELSVAVVEIVVLVLPDVCAVRTTVLAAVFALAKTLGLPAPALMEAATPFTTCTSVSFC